jgi:hypothetical protein
MTPQKWAEFGAELFIVRGGSVALDPAQIIEVNGEKVTSDHFFRSQGRDQIAWNSIPILYAGFRCVYPAKPLR